jgi:anthranilate phosphoribosyltransferase
VATIFNFLGPLANPAGLHRQVVGVGDAQMAEKMLGVLEANGARHCLVCYGDDGLDELTTTAPSVVAESRLLEDGSRERRHFVLDAAEYGVPRSTLRELSGGDPAENARLLRMILAGAAGAQREIVCWNAAAALYVGGAASGFEEGLELARATVDSGAAGLTLDRFVALSKELAALEASAN